jgi:hypothetical protein
VTSDLERDDMQARDGALGLALSSWAVAADVEVLGPLDAPGMDPTWIARFRSDAFEAELRVFYGPYVDVSAFQPNAPGRGYLVGGEEAVTGERLVQMLNDLAAATKGAPPPTWLKFAAA